jgi:hypothetical protein
MGDQKVKEAPPLIRTTIEKLYGKEGLEAYDNLKEGDKDLINREWNSFISLLKNFELYDKYIELRKKYHYSRTADHKLIVEALENKFPELKEDKEYKDLKSTVEQFEKQLDEKLENVKNKTKNEKIKEIATYYHDWDVEVLWRKLSLYIYYRYENPARAKEIADAIKNDKEIKVSDYIKVAYGEEEYIKVLPCLKESAFYNFCEKFNELSQKDLDTISKANIIFGKETNLKTPVLQEPDRAFKDGKPSITKEGWGKFFEEVKTKVNKGKTVVLKCVGFDPEINDPTFYHVQRVLYPWITKLRSLYTELWVINYCKEREKPEYLLFAFVLGENGYMMGIEAVKREKRERMGEVGKRTREYILSMIDAFHYIALRTDELTEKFLNLYKKDGEEINRPLEDIYEFLDKNNATIPDGIKNALKDKNTYPNAKTKSPDLNQKPIIKSSIFVQMFENTVNKGKIKPGMEKEKIEEEINNVKVTWPYFEVVTYTISSDPSSITYAIPKGKTKTTTIAQGTLTFKFQPNVYGVSDDKIEYKGVDKREYSCSLMGLVEKEKGLIYPESPTIKKENGSIKMERKYLFRVEDLEGKKIPKMYVANFWGYGENFKAEVSVKQKQINIEVSVTTVKDNLTGEISYTCPIKMEYDEYNKTLLEKFDEGKIDPVLVITLDKVGNIVYRLSRKEFEDLLNAAERGEIYQIKIPATLAFIPAHYKEIRLLEASLLFLPNLDKEKNNRESEKTNLQLQKKTKLLTKEEENKINNLINNLTSEIKALEELKDLKNRKISVRDLERLPNEVLKLHSEDVEELLSYYNITSKKTKFSTAEVPAITPLSTSYEIPPNFTIEVVDVEITNTQGVIVPFANYVLSSHLGEIRKWDPNLPEPKYEDGFLQNADEINDYILNQINAVLNKLSNGYIQYIRSNPPITPDDISKAYTQPEAIDLSKNYSVDKYVKNNFTNKERLWLNVFFNAIAEYGRKLEYKNGVEYWTELSDDEKKLLKDKNVYIEEKMRIVKNTNLADYFKISWLQENIPLKIEGTTYFYEGQINILNVGGKMIGVITGTSAIRLKVISEEGKEIYDTTFYCPISGLSLDVEIDKIKGTLKFTRITDGNIYSYNIGFVPRDCKPFLQLGAGGIFLLGKEIYIGEKKLLGIPIPGLKGSLLDIIEGLGTMGSVTLTMPYPGADWQATWAPRLLMIPFGRLFGVPTSISVDAVVKPGGVSIVARFEVNTPYGLVGVEYDITGKEISIMYSSGRFSMKLSKEGMAIMGVETISYTVYKEVIIPIIKVFQLSLAVNSKIKKETKDAIYKELTKEDVEKLYNIMIDSYLDGDYTLEVGVEILEKIAELINRGEKDKVIKIINNKDEFKKFINEEGFRRIKGPELYSGIKKAIEEIGKTEEVKDFSQVEKRLPEVYKKNIDMGEAKVYFDAIMAERAFNYIIEELKKGSQPDINKYPGYIEKKGDTYYIKFPTRTVRNEFMKRMAYKYNVKEIETYGRLWRYADLLSTDDKLIRMAGFEPPSLPGGETLWWPGIANKLKIEIVDKKKFESTYYAEVNNVDANVRSLFYDEGVIKRFRKAYRKGVYTLSALGDILQELSKRGKEKIDEIKSSEKALREFVDEIGLTRIKGKELEDGIKKAISEGITTFDEFKKRLPLIYYKRIDIDEAESYFWRLSGQARREIEEEIEKIKRDVRF